MKKATLEAAVNEGIIPKKQGKSLVASSARKAAVAAGAAKAEASLQSHGCGSRRNGEDKSVHRFENGKSYEFGARPAASKSSQLY